ncbi:UNVERIFIED_ORG: hypothetical protein E4P37_19090 [Bacillus sp. AZ43]
MISTPAPARRRVNPWPGVLLVVLLGLALLSAYGDVRLRAEAALACDDMDAGLGFSLNVLLPLVAGANCVGTFVCWLVFGRRYGVSGAVAALMVAALFLGLTTLAFFQLAPLPDGPLPGCPTGVPPWWPDVLPG